MKFYLTFDCEDFVNPLSTQALKYCLKLLKKYELRAIFFLTGDLCETLRNTPEVLDLLQPHEIGYHSTSHSVHPGILEYTDVKDYDTASKIALRRETSKINPLTGKIEGEGGLLVLHNVFPKKEIVSFRAPGFSWSPPHLEALGKLGIRFDFSTNLSSIPIYYKKITFYPFPILGFNILTSPLLPLGNMSITSLARLMRKSLVSQPLVLFVHPHDFTNAEDWDQDYFTSNPERLNLVRIKSWGETEKSLRCFELLLRRVHFLAIKGALEVTPLLGEGLWKTHFTSKQILQSYRRSTAWCERLFNYSPKFLWNHFHQYFHA